MASERLTCRTCLKENIEEYKHIYDVHESGELIGGILIDCTDLDISKDDEMKPKQICSDCYDQLMAWLKFKEMATESDQQLEEMVRKSSPRRKLAYTKASVKIKKVKASGKRRVYEAEGEQLDTSLANIKKVKVKEEIVDQYIDSMFEARPPSSDNDSQNFPNDVVKLEEKLTAPLSPCCLCTQQFDDHKSLELHATTEHADEVERNKRKYEMSSDVFVCSICAMKLPTYQRLQRHHMRYQNTVQCDQCGELVPNFKIANHRRIHSDLQRPRSKTKRENRHQCDICKRFLQSYAAIKYHMEIHFPRMIKCPRPDCDAVRETNRAMKFHLKEHIFRDQGKNLACPHCPQMFYGNQKARLKTHMRIHTGENPFQCPYCEKKFIDRTDWTRHQWSHTGVSPYMCQYCNQMHTRKKTLVQHEAVCSSQRLGER